MYKDYQEYSESSRNKKCIACDGDVRLSTNSRDSDYQDHICVSTGMIGWRCTVCDYCFHSPNKFGHSGSPLRCPKCNSWHVDSPS